MSYVAFIVYSFMNIIKFHFYDLFTFFICMYTDLLI